MRIAAVVAAMAFATVAGAATETFDFTGKHYGTYYKSKDFSGDYGSTVTVTAGTYKNYIKDGVHTAGSAWVGQWTGYGLGVWSKDKYGHEEHYVDGKNPEFLKFSFDKNVVLHSIEFLNYGNKKFDWYSNNGNGNINVPIYADVSGTDVGSMFFLGAWGKMGYKVKSITVKHINEVPLPAAGFLLLGGLGGIAALKRRKKA